jgi:UDPglucose 6-dehydrogenase
MKIAIVGIGFVGTAVARAFENNTLLLVDPKLNTDISATVAFEPNVSFVCTPTPSNDDGSINYDITLEAVQFLLLKTYGIVVVKSTVPPSFAAMFSKSDRVVFNPEFLTERNAVQDMVWADNIILGVTKYATSLVEEYSRQFSNCSGDRYTHLSCEEACWVKYATNTMLAVKVAYLNQLYDLFYQFVLSISLLAVVSAVSK